MTDCIGDQVQNERLDFRPAPGKPQSFVGIDTDIWNPVGNHCRPLRADKQLADINLVSEPQFSPGFDARQLQQLIDDVRHAIRLLLHLLQRSTPVFSDGSVIHHGLNITVNYGQRRAQFVRCVRHEIAAHLDHLLAFRDVANQ